MRTHGIGSFRCQYSWSFLTSGLPWAATILWQPMQRSTDGSPAYSDRRASAWQYWQLIWKAPAWIRWLNRNGWTGAPGGKIGPAKTSLGSRRGTASDRM